MGDPLPEWSRHASFCSAALANGCEIVLKNTHKHENAIHEWAVVNWIGANTIEGVRAGLVPSGWLPMWKIMCSVQEDRLPLGYGRWSHPVIVTPRFPVTLSDVVHHEGPLNPPRVFTIVKRIMGALEYMHARGWYHCDVKPSNIFIDHDGLAWLGDVGVAVNAEDIFDLDPILRLGYGTPEYQCQDAPAVRIDEVGLVITALNVMGIATNSQTLQELEWRVVYTVTHHELAEVLVSLCSQPRPKPWCCCCY